MYGNRDADRAIRRNNLRARVVIALTEHLQQGNLLDGARAIIHRRFPEVARTTIYRWVDAAMAQGLPDVTAAQQRAAKQIEIAGVASAVGQVVQTSAITSVPLFPKLLDGIAAIERVLAYAQGDNPEKPRNPRLTLLAAAQLIRALESGLSIHEALTQARRLDDFHAAIIAEIDRESPELAARVVGRLQALTEQIGA